MSTASALRVREFLIRMVGSYDQELGGRIELIQEPDPGESLEDRSLVCNTYPCPLCLAPIVELHFVNSGRIRKVNARWNWDVECFEANPRVRHRCEIQ